MIETTTDRMAPGRLRHEPLAAEDDFDRAEGVSPLARIAAVAESAPTTSRREEPSSANRAAGNSTVEPGDHRRLGDGV